MIIKSCEYLSLKYKLNSGKKAKYVKSGKILNIIFGIAAIVLTATGQESASVSKAGSLGPAELKQYLDKVIEHAKAASLYREGVDWGTVEKDFYDKAKNAETVEGLAPAFTFLLSALKDFHGKFYYKNQQIAYWYGELKENQKKIDPKIWSAIQSGQYKFKYRLLDKNTGYLRIAGLPMGDNLKMSQEIRNAVCELKSQKAGKWIIDLRYNGGGNMYPMLEGLAPILGDGVIGGAKDFNGKPISIWKIKDSDFYYDDELAVDLPDNCRFKSPPKVAVLTSQYTTSSGEVVAVAFKGRSNTRFFGENTSGFTTVTGWQTIKDNLVMSISTAFYNDRKGTIYRDYIDVDERVDFTLSEDIKNDDAVNKAIAWLHR